MAPRWAGVGTHALRPHRRPGPKAQWWRSRFTRKRKDGRTEWIPPPHLDTGQADVNNYHHPEKYLRPDEADEDQNDP